MDNKLNLSDLGDLANLKLDIGNGLKNVDLTTSYMPSVNMPKVDYSKITLPAQKHREEEKMYWEESLKLLKDIQNNTANLAVIVDLINDSNENQDEVIKLITEILEIAKCQTKEETESVYMKTIQKITTFNGDVENVNKLLGFAKSLYILVLSNIDKVSEIVEKVIK